MLTQNLLEKDIQQRLDKVLKSMAKAAEKSGRQLDQVELVTVSKKQSVEKIKAAYTCGLRAFGENYAEEAHEKMAALQNFPGLVWDMIGHVQSRKAKLVANDFRRVHSVDSLKLAGLLNQHRVDTLPPLEILLEVNISGEPSKSGIAADNQTRWDQVLPLVQELLAFPRLKLSGLMSMPPLFEDPNLSRPFFIKTRTLKEYLNQHIQGLNLQHLSMGTSSDYVVAIEEGATIIRIGEAILGPRIYPVKE